MTNEDIKGLDVKKGLAIVAGNKAIYLKLLNSFLNNCFCEQIVDAVNSGDMDQVRQKAHSLKGVAGNMYMDELFELSRAIEAAARDGQAINAGDDSIINLVIANRQTIDSVNMLIQNPDIMSSL